MDNWAKTVLSANELYRYRKPLDKTVPQRGGDKHFEPDDTWLQSKQLEKFYEERKYVLREQRVERLGGVVTGEWNPAQQLVELHKEMGKFWVHMGFIDQSRKWLYPEEALFLMETNLMEVWYKKVPLSIQQAYARYFTGNFTLEEYLVYSHLRRLGYVVLRCQGRLPVTKYERKIGLDKHIDLKRRKRKRKDENLWTKAEGDDKDKVQGDNIPKKSKMGLERAEGTVQVSDGESSEIAEEKILCEKDTDVESPHKILGQTEMATDVGLEVEGAILSENQTDDVHCGDQDHSVVLDAGETSLSCDSGGMEYVAFDHSVNEVYPRRKKILLEKHESSNTWIANKRTELDSTTKLSQWDFSKIDFPDLGLQKIVCLKRPSSEYLPEGVEILQEVMQFDMEQYNMKSRRKRTKCVYRDSNNFEFEFSYSEMTRTLHKIKAKNWTDYKQKLLEHEAQGSGMTAVCPAELYWKDEVRPLVRPQDATSTAAVLKRLQVIQSVKDTKIDRDIQSFVMPKVSFDVYKPDSKFKKSAPGVPHYRICVTRSVVDPPDLATLTALQHFFMDDVPLHWAVVEEGDVAFFSFNNLSLPQQIFMG